MKRHGRLVYILAVLITLRLVATGASAQTLTVLQRFDFPDHLQATIATLPQKISDQGDLIGTEINVNGTAQGFIYKFRLGKFSAAFHDPNDTGHDTQGRGINNLRHSCGEYLNGNDDTFHGYLLEHPEFIDFDITGAVDTIPLGINNAGDIVGTVIFGVGTQPAFVNWNTQQRLVTFAVPDATATFAYQVNTFHDIIGYYVDGNNIPHGYTRDAAGNLTFPIEVPGSTGTMLLGNNDENWGVGRYTDTSGATHGLYFITSDNILTFDAPFQGATFTSLNGINKNGQVCGYYVDSAGSSHGLVLQLDADAAPNPTATVTHALAGSAITIQAQPARMSHQTLKVVVPAL